MRQSLPQALQRGRNAITLSLEGGHSNSNLSSSSGYERRFWAVSASKGF